MKLYSGVGLHADARRLPGISDGLEQNQQEIRTCCTIVFRLWLALALAMALGMYFIAFKALLYQGVYDMSSA